MMMVSRREVVLGGLCLPLPLGASPEDASLKRLASERGLIYGAAVDSGTLLKDVQYRDTLAREAGMFVSEGAMKRRTLEPKPGRYNYAPALQMIDFARKNSAQVRGHTLLWHDANPDWLIEQIKTNSPDTLITRYVADVAGVFRGKLHSWDVVNEVIDPDDGGENGMRTSSPWYQAYGERYIDVAFAAAREADPGCLLFFNELNLEGDIWWAEKRRTATLKLLERLKKRNVPIDALGIQAHLKAYRVRYDQAVFSKFLDEVEGFGLKTMITELDIADIDGPASAQKRDSFVASLTRDFLDVAFSKKSALGCLTWGISDRYSWLSHAWPYKWADGSLGRVLPYDEHFRKKAMRDAIAMAYRCAPPH